MNPIIEQIKYRIKSADTLMKLLLINLGVFLLLQVFKTFLFLFNTGDVTLFFEVANKLALPASLTSIATQPWSIFTYMFLHTGFMHILVNLVVLYWTGAMFTQYLGEKKLLATYILGGLTGGLIFVIAYNVLPVFGTSLEVANLRGASAGVIAILVAIATLMPDNAVNLLIIGRIKLKYIAIFLIILYLISIPEGNAGGHLAHLGGALWGFIYIRRLQSGTDMAGGLSKIFERIGKYFKPRSKVKVVYSNYDKKKPNDEEYISNKQSQQEVIDKILDKISKSGYSSLSKEEKEILFKASNKS